MTPVNMTLGWWFNVDLRKEGLLTGEAASAGAAAFLDGVDGGGEDLLDFLTGDGDGCFRDKHQDLL